VSHAENDSGRSAVQTLGLFAGLVIAGVLILGGRTGGLLLLDQERPGLNSMAAVLALMAAWWITEAIPIYVTALLPLILFPLLKIPPGSLIANEYGHPLIFLFLGGFLIALAIEDSGLHRRVALLIISAVGDNPRRVVLGFMIATAGLSMWLSNTATTIMLLPIATSVLAHARREAGDDPRIANFGVALMLGLAYAASIGGVGTLIGTPPNVMFKGFFEEAYPPPQYPEYTFFRWMILAVPYSLTLLAIAWLLLTRVLYPLGADSFLGGRDVIKQQLRELGPVRAVEWRMLAVFLTTAFLWVFREPVSGVGWAPLLGVGKNAVGGDVPEGTKWVDDGTVAVFMALLCFVIPAGGGSSRPLLTWEQTRRLPWGILLLFGGGLALGSGMQETGLDVYLGGKLAGGMETLSPLGMMLATATGMTFLTELTSNMASINMLLPVLKGTSEQLGVDPRLLMIPATLASSCAFMLPVATAPNAIVYGSGYLRMKHMVKAGIWLNLIAVALIVTFVWLMGAGGETGR